MFWGLIEDNWRNNVRDRANLVIHRNYLTQDDINDYHLELQRIFEYKNKQTKKAVIAFLAGGAYITIDQIIGGALRNNLPEILTCGAVLSILFSPPYLIATRLERHNEYKFLNNKYNKVQNKITRKL